MKPSLVALASMLSLAASANWPLTDVIRPSGAVAVRMTRPPPEAAQDVRWRVLRDVLVEAGNLTARVALAPDRDGRIAAARTAAAQIRALIDVARWADDDMAMHATLLQALADALDGYDLPRIALLSDQRADAVIVLERQLQPSALLTPAGLAGEGR